MRLRIHRSTREIGGNCVELQSQGKSLLLDLGMPLVAQNGRRLLPEVDGLEKGGNENLVGVVLSHPHLDHYGLLTHAHRSVPVYLGSAATRMLTAAAPFSSGPTVGQTITPYSTANPFEIGPFRITPFLVDHSAFDAHALLVESDGKRVLYSGDFRLHGRKQALMNRLLEKPPGNIDVLLMEGTNIGRSDEPAEDEPHLESRIVSALRPNTGLALAYTAGQNIDRIVTFYRASLRSGRGLILDAYVANILSAIGLVSLPGPWARRVRVYLHRAQRQRLIRGGQAAVVSQFRHRRIYDEEIRRTPEQWIMLFRDSMRRDIEAIGPGPGGMLMYSMWSGYIERSAPVPVDRWAQSQGFAFQTFHTSGHASTADLKRFVEVIGPGRLIPIHTTQPERFEDLYARTEVCEDGVWVDI